MDVFKFISIYSIFDPLELSSNNSKLNKSKFIFKKHQTNEKKNYSI